MYLLYILLIVILKYTLSTDKKKFTVKQCAVLYWQQPNTSHVTVLIASFPLVLDLFFCYFI